MDFASRYDFIPAKDPRDPVWGYGDRLSETEKRGLAGAAHILADGQCLTLCGRKNRVGMRDLTEICGPGGYYRRCPRCVRQWNEMARDPELGISSLPLWPDPRPPFERKGAC